MAQSDARRTELELQPARSQPARAQAAGTTARRRAQIPGMYRAMIITSFVINMLLVAALAVVGGLLLVQRQQVARLVSTTQGFARDNIAELRDVVDDLEGATIVANVPLETSIPVQLNVPLRTGTVVTLTQQVPLQLPATVVLAGGAGQLAATVQLALPEGLQLPIALDLQVPIDQPLPVVLNVPVKIPLRETELGPQFQRLGAVVDRLVHPFRPVLGLPEAGPIAPPE